MSKLTQVVNGRYVGANKYTIKDAGGGKSTIDFSPDSVLEQGTQVGAELLNEIQKNSFCYLTGTHKEVGQESVYDCVLEGIDTFEFTHLNVAFKPNIKPTKSTVKLNIRGQVYTITGKLPNANQVALLLVKSEKKAYVWANGVEIVNDLETGGADKALSAEMGKELNEAKQNKTDSGLETDSKEIVGAINESLWRIKSKELGSSEETTDLDTIVIPGIYASVSTSAKYLHSPKEEGLNLAGGGFTLIVLETITPYQVGIIAQLLISRYNGAMFTRIKESSWSKWQEFISDKSLYYAGIFGMSSKPLNIQDGGTKTLGDIYLDNVTKKPYKCIKTTTSTGIDKNFFVDVSLKDNRPYSTLRSNTLMNTPIQMGQNVWKDICDIDINKYYAISLYYTKHYPQHQEEIGYRKHTEIPIRSILNIGRYVFESAISTNRYEYSAIQIVDGKLQVLTDGYSINDNYIIRVLAYY